jgi:thioesterase domain-containing protein
MLTPIQKSGRNPPLFFLHGGHGVMPLGSTFARTLGPDQPLYAVHLVGIDGRRPATDDVQEMMRTYVEAIHGARPIGPILIGGMCGGCLIAIEVTRELQEQGRRVSAVILADPFPMILASMLQNRRLPDPRQPEVARQLYQEMRRGLLDHACHSPNDLPFNANDPDQLHVAATAAVSASIAFSKHVPRPYPGPAQVIVSDERARAFFHPEMPWHKLLPGPRVVHVLPYKHNDLFRAGGEHFTCVLKFMLEEALELEIQPERTTNPALGFRA